MYIQENIINDTIFKWKLQKLMDVFTRGDFYLKSNAGISFWLKQHLGKITPQKKNIISKYYPQILKYIK